MVAVYVPTINKRKRIPQKAINQVVKQIVEKFKPQKIILFGSYAKGNPRPESDVDLLIVMNTQLREVQQAIQICQQIEYRFGLDLIVHTPKYLADRVKMGDSFLQDVLKEGKVIYEFGNN
jgi:predicted nucleotidyltransferase